MGIDEISLEKKSGLRLRLFRKDTKQKPARAIVMVNGNRLWDEMIDHRVC